MKKLVLLTNIMSPYRNAFFQAMYERGKEKGIDFHVLLMNDTEGNRQWNYADYPGEYSTLLQKKVYFDRRDTVYLNTDLEEKLEKMQPDILVLSGSYTLLPVWQALRWNRKNGSRCRLYFWSESHLDEQRNYGKLTLWVREHIRRRFYAKMDGFWYPGTKAKTLIEKYASPGVEFIQVPNLIQNRKFEEIAKNNLDRKTELREKYQLSLDKKIFFSPMRLTKVKGLMPFLKLVCQVAERDRIQIVVAGEGELKDEIRSFAEKNQLDVKLLGYKSSEEVAELLSLADVFLMPSLSDPNPLSCIEAIWCGKPLLVSRHVGNAPEVIVPGENGFVFSYEEPEKAIAMISELLNRDEEWYENAGALSEQIAREKFELIKNTDRILGCLEEVKR